ncbi:NAD(P)H-quinone oxidoreductase [Minwuia thermotolerans]|uniref:NAD(P)H-quinone oxidoreductase n=1 Tax=Minwuia thermotolerans TaxID=2056226 RepID=A0A2M9FVZ0_9PROT|nr:NAD(P)H-quinone oxidoreductase [Minwuia thermotolerans]PJK27636.1 NAD(P)H-quinone oxidoreductase [Minwuia thermotolerans]
MRVVSARKGGGPESLVAEDRPMPVPGPRDVLVEVAATGINRGDILQRARTYPAPPGTDYDVLGLEVSGRVVAAGDQVTLWKPGDRVCCLMKDGAYASHALADERLTMAVPENVDLAAAAALPEALFTVWTNVFDRGGLKRGTRFLVHGASSGIGVIALQLGRAFGAEVIASTGSDAKGEICRQLGAQHVINHSESDFVAEAKRLTGGEGVDLILDMVAGSYMQRNLEALAVEGKVVMIGLLESDRADFAVGTLLTRRLTITGSTLWARTIEQKAEIRQALDEEVRPLLESGAVRPVVDRVFPLERAGEAHDFMETNSHVGKILLRP